MKQRMRWGVADAYGTSGVVGNFTNKADAHVLNQNWYEGTGKVVRLLWVAP